MNKYDEYKALIDAKLTDFLPKIDDRSQILKKSMEYSLTAGGKRLRPVLMLASCDFAGGDPEEALPYACALEFIHTYSLIHDDLPAMDDDDLRRGKPTNHIMFGPGIATLAGDALLNAAYEVMIYDINTNISGGKKLGNRVKASLDIANAAGGLGMIAGQVGDLMSEHKEISSSMLEYIHLNKTAALIISPVRAGLFIGGADDTMLRNMTEYARCLGLAFQTADDILDVTGTREELGKTPGSDAAAGKNTFVSNIGMEKSIDRLHALTKGAIKALDGYGEEADFFRDLVFQLENRTA